MTSTIGPKEERLAIIPISIISPSQQTVNEIYSSADAVSGALARFSAAFGPTRCHSELHFTAVTTELHSRPRSRSTQDGPFFAALVRRRVHHRCATDFCPTRCRERPFVRVRDFSVIHPQRSRHLPRASVSSVASSSVGTDPSLANPSLESL